MLKTKRMSPRVRSILARLQPEQPRAALQGLEVVDSDFGAWLEAGGDRRSRPRAGRAQRLAGR